MRLDSGYNFLVNEGVTPAKLHAIVDDAFARDLVNSDLSSCRMFCTTTPASPSTGDVRISSTTGEFEFYNGSTWVSQQAFKLTLTLTNKSNFDLVTGDVVMADPSNSASFVIATADDQYNVIGVLGEDIANNASGSVVVRGITTVNLRSDQGTKGYLLSSPEGTSATAAHHVRAQLKTRGESATFGIALEVTPGSFTGTALIWK